MVDGQQWFQFSDKEKEKQIWKVKSLFEDKVKNIKIIVTGNAKVWDVGMEKIMHWWE